MLKNINFTKSYEVVNLMKFNLIKYILKCN